MANKTRPILEVKNISKNFGKNSALNDVSFNLEAGKILGLVGDNNAGKSTLLKILSGGLQPSSGKIYLNGEEMQFKSTADAIKKGIAIVYEFLELVNTATIWENFFMGRELTNRIGLLKYLDVGKMKHITAETVEKYGHTFNIEREAGELSGGQRQILAVTRAIDANSRILLLDEPTHGLSERIVKDIFSILREAKEKNNTSIIITSQWYEQISGFANYVLVLKRGDVVGRFDEESANAGKIFKLATGLAT
jgi:ABC-type sugar transport system ATPase subunit